jgi:hypothetical protein
VHTERAGVGEDCSPAAHGFGTRAAPLPEHQTNGRHRVIVFNGLSEHLNSRDVQAPVVRTRPFRKHCAIDVVEVNLRE